MLFNSKRDYRYLVSLILSILIPLIAKTTYADQPKIGEWGTAIAKFEIINSDVNNVKLENTVLSMLIKESGKDLSTFLEDDKKTLRSFKVSYRVPIKLKKGAHAKEEEIVQYGLFKALHIAMQQKLENKQTQTITVQYKTRDPLLIWFVVKDETFSAPRLLTDKIEFSKKPNIPH